ncbi:MAG: Txe/YoeB family addiction module toxin [Opitutales bacterium]|nr:Txe/YoeB family addiction module toxin [Opitutales bacterium]
MNVTFTPQAWEDYLYWQKTDKKTLKRIHLLIQDIQRSPHEGIGKPEALEYNLSGYWSRRITEEQRIVYKPFERGITFVQMRYHYQ